MRKTSRAAGVRGGGPDMKKKTLTLFSMIIKILKEEHYYGKNNWY